MGRPMEREPLWLPQTFQPGNQTKLTPILLLLLEAWKQ